MGTNGRKSWKIIELQASIRFGRFYETHALTGPLPDGFRAFERRHIRRKNFA
jgi:hypothetical protein